MTSNLGQVFKSTKVARMIGKLPISEQEKLEEMYTSRLAANGSARNLQKTSKMSVAKVEIFVQQKDALTKYRQIQSKFSRHKSNCLRTY